MNRENVRRCHRAHLKTMRHVAFAVIHFESQKTFRIVCMVAAVKSTQIVLSVALNTTKAMENLYNVLFAVPIGALKDLIF